MARRSTTRKRKSRSSHGRLWLLLLFCLACLGVYQLVQIARNAVTILQQQCVGNKNLWQTIQARFWERDVPHKPTKKITPRKKSNRPSGFSPQDKAKLERILDKGMQ
ncbi:MAG: hypothetical protein AAF310_05110 [Myxococcota bacterium]